MKKILVVMGTRPEAIKMAPVIEEFRKYPLSFQVKVCVTAQHREILDNILSVFELSPDYDLDIMQKDQDLYDITANVLLKVKTVLAGFKPDMVFVQGDTTTTFATALAAFYQKIDVGHIEAGLRTGDNYSPYPEEINRQLTTKIARYHFAPTELNRKNLLKENIKEENITVTGNTVIDALFMIMDRIKGDKELEKSIIKKIRRFGFLSFGLDRPRRFILVTGHRRENFGQGFLNICHAIKNVAGKHPETDIVYPVHLNPNVRNPVNDILSNTDNIYLIEPLDYLAFVYLMSKSFLILTDSGGIQEEAPSLAKPVLVMRDTTERPEAVEAGTAKIVGTDQEEIFNAVNRLLSDDSEYKKMSEVHNPYGDGMASQRIVEFIKRQFRL